MKKNCVIKAVCFLCIAALILVYFNKMFTPEYYYDTDWASTSTFEGFYKIPDQSIDVLFLGSSCAAAGFNVQNLYDNYGITSYNLSSEHQSLFASYYWLEECLRFQTPKVVVLESKFMFDMNPGEPLNMSEPYLRKAFDSMKWSEIKKEAVNVICQMDEEQSKLSYYLPFVRFHSRWTELTDKDLISYTAEASKHNELKGSVIYNSKIGSDIYPFNPNDFYAVEDTVPIMMEYMDKIVNLCETKGINLILTMTPTSVDDIYKFHAVNDYANSKGLRFVDFNEISTFAACGYEYAINNCDQSHANLWGANKITNYMADILVNEYGLTSHSDSAWDASEGYYQQIITDFAVQDTWNLEDYLRLMVENKDRYSYLLAFREEATPYLSEEDMTYLRNLGIGAEFLDKTRCSYFAVIANGEVIERQEFDAIEGSGVINHKLDYSIASAAIGLGYYSSICINGTEYAKPYSGLNIVIVDNGTNEILDAVCFNTCVESKDAYR